MNPKYILVGGNPFRNTYTGLRVFATTDDNKELQNIWNVHYDDAGGLLLWVNAHTGESVNDVQAEVNQ